ncbi:MAG TPA: DNA polymerase [Gammaproteobacteria bacterium]|nr:DNA polymerase [Gammaproteobacteria bacterium]
MVAREDHVLLFSDFDQIEMRVMAHLAKDQGLINAFTQYEDFFSHLGSEIYHDPAFTKKDPRRPVVKNTGYCTIYGGGVEKIAATAKVSVEEAEYVYSRFNELYPNVSKFMMEVIKEGKQKLNAEGKAYTRSPLTNRLLVADDDRVYALTNYMIQGTAAELIKTKLIQLDMAGLGEYMILPVHDEVILDVPRYAARDAVETIKSIMNDDKIFSVPVTAGIAYGERWGEKVEL